jgi:gliding motility-associated-like protein
LTYSDGINSYTQTNVQSDVPFAVQTTPVSTTTYTISAIQDNSTGCTTNGVSGVTGTLTVNTSSGTDFAFDQNICNPLNVTFSGISQTGTSYSWTINGINYAGNSSQNQSFTDTGTYPVKLKTTSPNGCVDSTSKNISINFRNGNSISTNDTVICSGHNVQLSAKPALQYCWTPGATLDNPALANPTASPTVTTTYYLTSKITGTNLVINGNFESGNTGFSSACVYDPVNVTEGEYFVGTSPHNWNANAPVDCGDHTSGSGNMMIVNGAQTPDVNVWATSQISVQPNTNYAFSAWTQSISPYNPATLQFSINGLKSGNSINANANTCIWNQFYTIWNSGSNTTATISLVNENTFFLGNDFALDDISFAPVTLLQDSVIVTVEAPAVTAFPDTSVCPGSPVRLTAAGSLATGAFTYSWTPSAGLSDSTRFDPIALPSVTTNYIVTATTTHGCTATTSVLLNVFPGVNIGLTPDTTICPGASLQLQASGGFGYSWTPSQFLDNSLSSTPQAAPADTTRFFVTVTDRNNCSAKDSVLVRVRPPVLFNAPSNEEICKGYSVMLKSVNSEAYVYNWSPADGLSDPSAPFPTAGPAATVVYTVNMSDPVCGHDSIFNVSVTVKPGPNVKAQKANDIDCAITTAQLSATGAVDYLWTPEEGLNNSRIPNPIASIDSSTTYIVQGTDENGCSAFDTLTVKVTAAGHNLFVVPNAFTPNGDGRNDCFGIRRWGDVRVEEFSVYNRWGGRVFTTRNPSDCWDGYFNGKPQEAGTYVYIIRAWSFCGEITRKGTVMLIR